MKKNVTVQMSLLLSVMMVLEGCARLNADKEVMLPVSHRFPIEVTDTDLKLVLKSDGSSGSLTAGQISQLDAFAATYFVRGKGAIEVGYTEDSFDSSLMVAALREHLHEAGIDWKMINIMPVADTGQSDAGNISLSFSTSSTRSRVCDQKNRGGFSDASKWHNAASASFGCATQTNIAAMIADPSELQRPATLQPADSERRIDVLGKYRRGEVTAQSSDPIVSQTTSREIE